jgi:hypothetical protein
MFLFKFLVTLTAVHSNVYILRYMACLTYNLHYNLNIVTGSCGIRTGMSSIFSIGHIEESLQASVDRVMNSLLKNFILSDTVKTWPKSHRHHIIIQYHRQSQQL